MGHGRAFWLLRDCSRSRSRSLRPLMLSTGAVQLPIEHGGGDYQALPGAGAFVAGDREFDRLENYRRFAAEVAERANARLAKALAVERACLRPLPERRAAAEPLRGIPPRAQWV